MRKHKAVLLGGIVRKKTADERERILNGTATSFNSPRSTSFLAKYML